MFSPQVFLNKDKENLQIKLNNNFWLFIFVCILLAGVFSVFIVGRNAKNEEVERLLNRAETIAASIDYKEVQELKGRLSDIENPSYDRLKSKMSDIKLVNPDVRFVYIMGYPSVGVSDNKLFFYVDSENPSSIDYSAPGDVYEETTDFEIQNFKNAVSFVEGPYVDKWGSWISGYAPVINKDNGKVVAIVGLDISSHEWNKRIVFKQLLPLSLTFSIFFIVLSYYLDLRRKSIEIGEHLEFVSVASHQLRNPLSSIKWSMEILLNGKIGELNSEQQKYIKHSFESNERMINLVNDLLRTSKADEITKLPDKTLVDCSKIIEEIEVDMVGLLQKNNIKLDFSSLPKNILLNVNYTQIREVFMNVVSNAVKYSKFGGVVEIKFYEKNKMAVFSIIDHGFGIPTSSQDKIFKRFYRAKNVVSKVPDGNGLGLYIARRIVEKHKGKLYFVSKENEGTTFFVELPKN